MTSIFISYSSEDVEAGSRLRDLLASSGYATVFRDRDEQHGIPAGTKWAAELFANLDRADVIVFLASTASLKSPWCHTELAVAAARGKHIVQVARSKLPTHPVLMDRQKLAPEANIERLVRKLVTSLSRVGFPPGDAFTWDANRSPYPGLRRFDTDHAAVLFGRDAERAACLERLAASRPPPLLVSGPSGCGKSSLVRAAVLPRLALQEGTVVLPVVEPGNSPLQRIALSFSAAVGAEDGPVSVSDPHFFTAAIDRLLAAGGTRVVLFLDQAEDLVTRAAKDEIADLVRRLEAVEPDRLLVIAAVRSASIDLWLQEPALAWLSRADPVLIRPLDRNGLRQVVLRPAQLAGIRFDPPDLVERILDDTGEGNALPLLAALLGELTQDHTRLTPAVITAEQYDTVGPVGKVIERWAAAATLDIRARRGLAESDVIDAYLRLAEVGEEAQITPAELAVDDMPIEVREIFSDLEQHRLVTRDQRVVAGINPTGVPSDGDRSVEVVTPVHEEVFRSWPALAATVKAHRHDLEIRTWLRRDARVWRESGGGQAPLAGGRLELGRAWAERNPAEVTQDINDYIKAAVQQARLRRVLTIAAPALAVIAVVVGGLAFQAITEAQRANAARSEANALRIAGEARTAFAERLDLGLMLALEAAARSEDLQIRGTPLIGLSQGPGPRRFEDVGQPIEDGALDDGGHRAILAVRDGVLLWDVDAGHAITTMPRQGEAVAISGDGATIAVDVGDGFETRSWPTGQVQGSCKVGVGDITDLKLSDGGDLVVVVADDRADPDNSWVAVMHPPLCVPKTMSEVHGRVTSVDIDAANDRVALGSEEDGPGVWQISTGLPYGGLRSGDDIVRSIAFGSGDRLAAVTPNGELLLWDVMDLQVPPREFRIHDRGGAVVALSFGATNDGLVAGTSDGVVRLIQPDGEPPVGSAIQALPALDYEGESVEPLDLAADGSRTVTIDPSGRVVIWDLEGRHPLGPQLAGGHFIRSVAPLPDGSVLAADSRGAYVLDRVDGTPIPQVSDESVSALAVGPGRWAVGIGARVLAASQASPGVEEVASVPNNQVVAIAALPEDGWAAAFKGEVGGGTVIVVTATGERHERELTAEPSALATDGRWLFIGDMDGVVHVLDAADVSQPERTFTAHDFDVASMAVSPDHSTLATGSDDRAVALWNLAVDGTAIERTRLLGHSERVTSLTFSPDGHWLASAGEEPAVLLWNLDLGQQIGDPIAVGFNPTVAFAQGADRQLLVAHGRLDLWDMRMEQWPSIACQIIGSRRLAAAEQQKYLRDEAPISNCQ